MPTRVRDEKCPEKHQRRGRSSDDFSSHRPSPPWAVRGSRSGRRAPRRPDARLAAPGIALAPRRAAQLRRVVHSPWRPAWRLGAHTLAPTAAGLRAHAATGGGRRRPALPTRGRLDAHAHGRVSRVHLRAHRVRCEDGDSDGAHAPARGGQAGAGVCGAEVAAAVLGTGAQRQPAAARGGRGPRQLHAFQGPRADHVPGAHVAEELPQRAGERARAFPPHARVNPPHPPTPQPHPPPPRLRSHCLASGSSLHSLRCARRSPSASSRASSSALRCCRPSRGTSPNLEPTRSSGRWTSPRSRRDLAATSPRPRRDLAATSPRPRHDLARPRAIWRLRSSPAVPPRR